MRVLVTGGAGFIGSHFVDLLVARGHATTVLDNLDPQVHGERAEPRHIHDGAIRFLRGDVTDRAAVAKSLHGVEAVVRLAATVGVGQSMYAPYYYVKANSAGTACC